MTGSGPLTFHKPLAVVTFINLLATPAEYAGFRPSTDVVDSRIVVKYIIVEATRQLSDDDDDDEEAQKNFFCVSSSLISVNLSSFGRGELLKCTRSPPPMNTCNPKGATSAFPTSWKMRGCLMEEIRLMEDDQVMSLELPLLSCKREARVVVSLAEGRTGTEV
ncbi:hypothetical protein EVAR_76125_1 [Eumeta japonica]|uniref:Uncharacterized protein n=1 Tax=Eumeta variegata TaxID=151549 RepID=A0A4C1UXT7_EUMVA|nr:hypothetical protein EVAR_76125_1 [Eumeta japonica]